MLCLRCRCFSELLLFLSFLLSAYFMKPLFNLVVVPSVEMSWIEDGGEKKEEEEKTAA